MLKVTKCDYDIFYIFNQCLPFGIVLFTNFQISTCVTNYQSSINGAYSSKHVRLHDIFYKVKYLLIEESYNDG